MFQGVVEAGSEVAVTFRGLDAAACTLAEQLGTPDAGPTAWRLLREHIRGRGWQNVFSVWQNFPGRPGTQAVISPQENEVTIWAVGEKPVTMPFRNWQHHALETWWKACLHHLRPYIPGKPDPALVYSLVDIAKSADGTTDDSTTQKTPGWRILWATPVAPGAMTHSPHGPGGLIPCLQVFSASGATATFGVDVVELRDAAASQGEMFDMTDPRLPGEWEQCCRKNAPQTAPAAVSQPVEEPESEETVRTITFTGKEAEAVILMRAMAEATPGGQVKWSITRERADALCVMRVILDETGH